MPQLREILEALQSIAPLNYAEPWDNVGLLTGDPLQNITNILLTIDYTKPVAAEARNLNCDLIIAYHPPIFSAIKKLTADGPGALMHDAIRRGVAIYSPHTAWDAADGGTNDFLVDCLSLENVEPLQFNSPSPTVLKLVTFVPEAHLDRVSAAVFDAGAGHIGRYHSCSFRAAGTGTFFGEEGTHPSVGESNKLEIQPEVRLETIVPAGKVNAVIGALLNAHPYEEPAYDLTMLTAPPTGHGQGRIGTLATAIPTIQIIDRLKQSLNLKGILFTGDPQKEVKKIAICAGSGGELLDAAIAARVDLFLTGELRHHDALKAKSANVNVICTLHSNCERPSLRQLMIRLQECLPDCPPIFLSQSDQDPFQIY